MANLKNINWQTAINNASERINEYIYRTPLLESPCFSLLAPLSKVYVKLESEQITGSFKVRGVFNKLLIIRGSLRDKGPITASTGNHALALNHAMKKLGITGTIVVPRTITAAKDQALKLAGANPVYHGDDCVDAENYARYIASVKLESRVYISPYNDLDVIIGQGTIGKEILDEVNDLDAILIPVGGGGLIGGVAAYMKSVNPRIRVYGCQPRNSDVMYDSVKSGHIVFKESQPTLSDGTAGGIEQNAMTYDLCCKYVDYWFLVDEDEIGKGIYTFLDYHHKVVEGAAGVAFGAFIKNAFLFKGQKVAIVACGGNISTDTLVDIIDKHKKVVKK